MSLPFNNKGISVIIPNYNGAELLPEILPSLYSALSLAALPYEVIICDDFSTDQSVEVVKKNYPAITLITNLSNLGFSPTINKGIKIAQYDFVFLLNSDVKVCGDYFKPLLRYFEKENTFGVMGRIVNWDNDDIQDGAKYPSFHGVKIKTTGNYLPQHPEGNSWLYSMYLSGANAFICRKKLMALEGFDEIYAPFYVEDYDLSVRAWRLGWKCYYEHFSVCRHKTSVTIKQKSKKAFINKIYYRNKMFLHAIHLPAVKKIFWYFQLIIETLIRIVSGRFYYVKSVWLFLLNTKAIAQSKNKLSAVAKKNNLPLLSLKNVTDEISVALTKIKISKI